MFRLHGFYTQHTCKALYVLAALDEDFEFVFTDLSTGVQRSPEFLAMNPAGKAPVLEHDGKYLFESGAICRYAANVTGSDLYPSDPYERALVDQWLDYFVCHPGRWLTSLYFQNVIKPRVGMGDPDPDTIKEATEFATQQLQLVDDHLANNGYLANNRLSIADLAAYAYVEQESDLEFSIAAYPNVVKWYERLGASDPIVRGKARLQ
ncbi:MAG: glutathione S-transferase family protein [Pseudomonadota bacterium]